MFLISRKISFAFITFLTSLLIGCANHSSDLVSHKGFESVIVKNDSLLTYVLVNYGKLSGEIIKGDGDYLQSFYILANTESQNQAQLLSELKQALVKEKDIYQFALNIESISQKYTSNDTQNTVSVSRK